MYQSCHWFCVNLLVKPVEKRACGTLSFLWGLHDARPKKPHYTVSTATLLALLKYYFSHYTAFVLTANDSLKTSVS